MLQPSQFQQWCQRLQLPPATCALIARLRTAPPARRVQSSSTPLANPGGTTGPSHPFVACCGSWIPPHARYIFPIVQQNTR